MDICNGDLDFSLVYIVGFESSSHSRNGIIKLPFNLHINVSVLSVDPLLYVMFMQKRNKYYFSLFIIVCKWLWQDSNEWSPVFSLNKMLLLWLFLWMRLQDVKILSEIMFCFRMIRKICVQWTLKQMSRKWRGGKELKQSWTAKYEKDI